MKKNMTPFRLHMGCGEGLVSRLQTHGRSGSSAQGIHLVPKQRRCGKGQR